MSRSSYSSLAVIVTSSVVPSVVDAGCVIDPSARLLQYRESLNFLARITGSRYPIYVVDTSNYFSGRNILDSRINIIELNEGEKQLLLSASHLGKGVSECILIDACCRHLSMQGITNIAKITGRTVPLNILDVIDCIDHQVACLSGIVVPLTAIVQSRVLGISTRWWLEHSQNIKKAINEKEGIYLEHALSSIKPKCFRVLTRLPIYGPNSLCGHTGNPVSSRTLLRQHINGILYAVAYKVLSFFNGFISLLNAGRRYSV